MQRLSLSICICFSFFWLTGCSLVLQEEVLTEHILNQHTQLPELNSDLSKELLKTNTLAYEWDSLHVLISKEFSRWHNNYEAIPFLIYDFERTGNEYIGLYRAEKSWSIKGKTASDSVFVLESNEDKITLIHAGHQETYQGKEFNFLLPRQHIQLIQDILKEKQYEYLSWSKFPEGYFIELCTSIQLIDDLFANYIAEHFGQTKVGKVYPLRDFSVLYQLRLKEENGHLVLKGLVFLLIKNEKVIDKLEFGF